MINIPEGWKWAKFDDVAKHVKVNVDPIKEGLERYVAGEHMETDNLRIKNWGIVGDGYLGPAFHRKFIKNHILYGSRRTYLRKVAVADFNGVCANTTFVIEARDKMVQDLLPFLMQSDAFTEHSIKNSKGSTNPYINWKDIGKYQFPLPPIEEQRMMAEVLLAVENLIQKMEDLVDFTNRTKSLYSHNLFKSVFIGKSKEKKWNTIYDIIDINPKIDKTISDDTEVAFIPMEYVSEEGVINKYDVKTYSEVKNGFTYFENNDILFAKITPCMENGKGALVSNIKNGIGFGSTEYYVLRPKDKSDSMFIYQMTMNLIFRFHAKRFMRGSAGQLRVPKLFFKKFKQNLPPKEERMKIGKVLSMFDNEKQIQKQHLKKIKNLKYKLLNNLLNGTTRLGGKSNV